MLRDGAFTVAEVADRVGVSPATLYRYLPAGRGRIGGPGTPVPDVGSPPASSRGLPGASAPGRSEERPAAARHRFGRPNGLVRFDGYQVQIRAHAQTARRLPRRLLMAQSIRVLAGGGKCSRSVGWDAAAECCGGVVLAWMRRSVWPAVQARKATAGPRHATMSK